MFLLIVIMLSIRLFSIMLNVILLCLIMLNVIQLNVSASFLVMKIIKHLSRHLSQGKGKEIYICFNSFIFCQN